MRRFVTTLAAVLLAACAGPPARAKPPVWIVRDADSELVLFGSVHLLPSGLDWRPKALKSALASAQDVWFELPIDAASEAETSRLAVQYGLLGPDQSLFKMLPPADAQRLGRVARAYGVDPATLDRLRPWLAEVALGAAAYRKAGAGAADGVERTLAAEAPPAAQRRAFETPLEQVEILAGASPADQLASLRQTLEELEDEPDEFQKLVRAWMAGDLAAIDREAIRPLRAAAPDLFRRLVSDRNARWAQVLDARLKGRGRTVVIVGMGHLIGPDGLPARLRALGYRVEGP
jgi:uncharacterized protein YbaP (TraB family)